MCALGVLGPEVPNTCPDRVPLWLNDTSRGQHVPSCLWAIRATRSMRAFGTDPMGMLILTSAAPPSRAVPDPFVLVSMFGFTAAEARIAAHLIAGAAPKQIASVLNLQMPTVRFHIRQLLAKCKCHDQRQLMRRLSEALEVNGL
jgi:DNA-binding CsgD family transcriptional regulator